MFGPGARFHRITSREACLYGSGCRSSASDHADHGGVRADADGQRESRAATKPAHGIPHVVKEAAHPRRHETSIELSYGQPVARPGPGGGLMIVSTRWITLALAASCLALTFNVPMRANGNGTRLLRMPTVNATEIAFAYANNIWVVDRAGGTARRLTSFQGQTSNPHFSPDGKWIAFSGEYAGNVDVYVMPADGGEPKRLTWHPGADTVQGWTVS